MLLETAAAGIAASPRPPAHAPGPPPRCMQQSSIRAIPDFPKPGISFKDITTLLLNPTAFKHTIDLFVERYKGQNVTAIAGEQPAPRAGSRSPLANNGCPVGFEARGFIFGPPVALALGCAFVPLRKPKKLPGETIGEDYALEYGTDRIEMHVGALKEGDRVVLIDDLIATGGTLAAGIRLVERVSLGVTCLALWRRFWLNRASRRSGPPWWRRRA